jgi:hypothetical protein
MSRKTIASVEAACADTVRILTARNAECLALRLRVSVLEGELTLRPRVAINTIAPIVTHYRDHMGRLWEKTRLGNKATSRVVA